MHHCWQFFYLRSPVSPRWLASHLHCLWVGSNPPYFCAATETVANIANQQLALSYAQPHPSESLASTPMDPLPALPLLASGSPACVVTVSPLPIPSTSVTTSPLSGLLSYIDVYMDDFMGLVQGNCCP